MIWLDCLIMVDLDRLINCVTRLDQPVMYEDIDEKQHEEIK